MLLTKLQGLAFPFAFSLTNSIHFQSYLGQYPFPALNSGKLFYTFMIPLELFVTSSFATWDPLIS